MGNTIGKIVELLIDWDDMEFDEMGVSIMSLVDKPAIGISWQAFAEQYFDVRENKECPDGFEHLMPDGSYMCGKEHSLECEDCFDLDDACWPGYEAIGMKPKGGREVPNCVPIANAQEFAETYNDYPESAKNNAQRALDWAEENGWGSCGTGVGKARANQLAKGENISEDTIARMSAFARHKKNSKTPYSEGCGKLMWDAWGGTSGIEWASGKLKRIRSEKQSEEVVDPIIELASQLDFGEVLDYANTIEINQSQANFADLTDTLKAIIGLDILGKKDPKEEGELKYRYSGPSPQRTFCRSMMRLNKVYTRKEIDRMAGLNPGFGLRGASTYNIFKYKGGPNCQHYWEAVRLFKEGRRTVVVSEGPAFGDAGEAPEQMPNSGYAMSQWTFDAEDDQMIITGPAMTPNIMIPRSNEDGENFHVYFTEETIEKISRKFLEESKHNNTDINHNDNVVNENTLLESWIVEDPDMDKSKKYGFDVPKGTWMVSYAINNPDTWEKIKNKELNGFSITGQFIERATKK